jgi:hypothetical protein
MEAKYNGLSLCMRDLLPFKRLFLAVAKGIGLADDVLTTFKTTVWDHNNGTLTLAKMEQGRMTPHSKHYAVSQVPLVPFTFDPESNGSQKDRYQFAEGIHFHQGIANR